MGNRYFFQKIRIGVVFFCALVVFAVSEAQPTKSLEQLKQQVEKSRRDLDSLSQKSIQSLQKRLDSITLTNLSRNNERGFGYIQQLQEERKKEQRKKAIRYIGFGAAMAAVLVYGLSRKKKVV